MSQKKFVGRNIAIALGIVCIILIAGIGGAIAYYTMKVNDLNDTLNLSKSEVWINSVTISQPAGAYNVWYWFTNHTWYLPYSGYMSVLVSSSTTSNTYVRAIYSVNGINYDNQISVGASGTAVFPIIAPVNVQIRVGNTNFVNSATETITITYYY